MINNSSFLGRLGRAAALTGVLALPGCTNPAKQRDNDKKWVMDEMAKLIKDQRPSISEIILEPDGKPGFKSVILSKEGIKGISEKFIAQVLKVENSKINPKDCSVELEFAIANDQVIPGIKNYVISMRITPNDPRNPGPIVNAGLLSLNADDLAKLKINGAISRKDGVEVYSPKDLVVIKAVKKMAWLVAAAQALYELQESQRLAQAPEVKVLKSSR